MLSNGLPKNVQLFTRTKDTFCDLSSIQFVVQLDKQCKIEPHQSITFLVFDLWDIRTNIFDICLNSLIYDICLNSLIYKKKIMSRKSPGILWPNLLMGPTDYHGIGNDDDNNEMMAIIMMMMAVAKFEIGRLNCHLRRHLAISIHGSRHSR